MTTSERGRRVAGALAVVAAPLTLTGLVLGLTLVDFDAEAFREPRTVLGLGADAAGTLRASYLLVMLGSYLLLVPAALWLATALGRRDDPVWRTATVSGLAYLGLGAAGSAVLAAVWPDLVERAAEDGADLDTLVVAFSTATRIAEDGLQGVLQNLAGAVWWVLVGLRLLGTRLRGLAVLTLVLGAASTLNAVGGLLSLDALVLVGLSATVLLGPVWAVWVGISLLRGQPAAPTPSPSAAAG